MGSFSVLPAASVSRVNGDACARSEAVSAAAPLPARKCRRLIVMKISPSSTILSGKSRHIMSILQIRNSLETVYPDILTADALSALEALAHFDADRRDLMAARIAS